MEFSLNQTANALSPWEAGVFSLVVYTGVVVLLLAVVLFLTGWLGEKKESLEKRRPYEGGIVPTGWARFHYPVPFYLVAAFFLIFDVEAAYIFSWAVAFDKLGIAGLLQMSFFIAVLLIGLFYIWMKGGLDWGPTIRRKESPRGDAP